MNLAEPISTKPELTRQFFSKDLFYLTQNILRHLQTQNNRNDLS